MKIGIFGFKIYHLATPPPIQNNYRLIVKPIGPLSVNANLGSFVSYRCPSGGQNQGDQMCL
jgi:hypothetical protein